MGNDVYITRLSRFLPNDPIPNESMEDYLGMVGGKPSKARGIVLRNNGIKTRYYALDKERNITHTNAEMTAEAIRELFGDGFEQKDMELLAVGTTSPDQLLPSHASMVHGELGGDPVEIIAPSGSCCSGSHAFKYAYLSLLAGDKKNAVCAGSERLSALLIADRFQEEAERLIELNSDPYIAFEKEFLRWMLSDGAAAALLQTSPGKDLSLKVEWVESRSYANELETCMYLGGEKLGSGALRGWGDLENQEWLDRSIFSIKQDVKLLRPNIVPFGGKMMKELFDKYGIGPDDLDFFLPHLSSEFFRERIEEETKTLGIHIPQEKWFTNLTRVGNVGSASVYFMMEELFNSGRLEPGQKILLMVPESARFSYVYALLTVVSPQ